MANIIKTLRFTAIFLIFFIALTLLSGFVSMKTFLSPWFPGLDAYYWHTVIVPVVFVPLVYVHSLMGILLFFARNQKFNKTYLKVAAAGLWTALFVLFGYMYVAQNSASNILNTSNLAVSGETVLTMEEVARHMTASDCWMIVSGKVYNVSDYATSHPGGAEAITSFCGKDGTVAFSTKGGKGSHSESAQKILASFYVGNIGGNVSSVSVKGDEKQTVKDIVPKSAIPAAQTSKTVATLTLSEIARHASASDCWMIIGGKAYNLSGYATAHPGGTQNITSYCGKDGTVAFSTKGGQGNSHSSGAQNLLASFYLGDVGGAVSESAVIKTTTSLQNVPKNGGDDDDDD